MDKPIQSDRLQAEKRRPPRQPSEQESKEKQEQIRGFIQALEGMEGYVILMGDLKEAIAGTYRLMASGTKEEFDAYKGQLNGLRFLLNRIESYKNIKK